MATAPSLSARPADPGPRGPGPAARAHLQPPRDLGVQDLGKEGGAEEEGGGGRGRRRTPSSGRRRRGAEGCQGRGFTLFAGSEVSGRAGRGDRPGVALEGMVDTGLLEMLRCTLTRPGEAGAGACAPPAGGTGPARSQPLQSAEACEPFPLRTRGASRAEAMQLRPPGLLGGGRGGSPSAGPNAGAPRSQRAARGPVQVPVPRGVPVVLSCAGPRGRARLSRPVICWSRACCGFEETACG